MRVTHDSSENLDAWNQLTITARIPIWLRLWLNSPVATLAVTLTRPMSGWGKPGKSGGKPDRNSNCVAECFRDIVPPCVRLYAGEATSVMTNIWLCATDTILFRDGLFLSGRYKNAFKLPCVPATASTIIDNTSLPCDKNCKINDR